MRFHKLLKASAGVVAILAFAVGMLPIGVFTPTDIPQVEAIHQPPVMAVKPPTKIQVSTQIIEVEEVEVQKPQTFSPIESAIPDGSVQASWMRAAGIAESDFKYVDFIIDHESSWNPQAINLSSGACGLAQQYPCGKWAHQWDDPVGSLIDASNYAKQRYGSWLNAYTFWINNRYW